MTLPRIPYHRTPMIPDEQADALARFGDGFLREILGRPENERPYVIIPVGYPAADATVPDLARKPLSEILVELPDRG